MSGLKLFSCEESDKVVVAHVPRSVGQGLAVH